jgi:hypothetical protein
MGGGTGEAVTRVGARGDKRSKREQSAGSRSMKEARRSVPARRSYGSEVGWRRCPAA